MDKLHAYKRVEFKLDFEPGPYTYPIEHQVSALASDLSMDDRYAEKASWTRDIAA